MNRRFTLALVAGLPIAAGCSSLFHRETTRIVQAEEKDPRVQEAKPTPAPRIHASTYLAAGQMLEKQGEIAGAITQYERAVSAEPRLAQAYNRLGILYQKQRRYAEAENILKRGIEADSGAAMLHNNLGYVLLVQQRFGDAEAAFREALRVAPDFRRARMNLAIALAQTGRLDESAREFSQVVPGDTAHFNVAVICLRRGDSTQAEASLRKALALNPKCPGAQEQLDRLVRMSPGRRDDPQAAPPTGPLAGGAEDEPTRGP